VSEIQWSDFSLLNPEFAPFCHVLLPNPDSSAARVLVLKRKMNRRSTQKVIDVKRFMENLTLTQWVNHQINTTL
jgi:hypothetical protein